MKKKRLRSLWELKVFQALCITEELYSLYTSEFNYIPSLRLKSRAKAVVLFDRAINDEFEKIESTKKKFNSLEKRILRDTKIYENSHGTTLQKEVVEQCRELIQTLYEETSLEHSVPLLRLDEMILERFVDLYKDDPRYTVEG